MDHIPPTSEVISIFGRYFIGTMALMSLATYASVFVVHAHNLGSQGTRPSRLVRKVFIEFFGPWFGENVVDTSGLNSDSSREEVYETYAQTQYKEQELELYETDSSYIRPMMRRFDEEGVRSTAPRKSSIRYVPKKPESKLKMEYVFRRNDTNKVVGADLVNLAKRIVDFAKLVAAIDSVAEVIVCQVLPRVMVRPTGRSRFPTRADFNSARFVVNRTLDALTTDLPHVHYWQHRGMHANWPQYFDRFGVHLDDAGMRKYMRNVRGAAIMPRGRTSTTRGAAVIQPSQRRAAIRKRAAETAPPMPAPPVRRRRPVSAAAGRPDESVIPDGGPPTVSTSTAEMMAIVTREVLKQLRDDRAAEPVAVPPASVDVPATPIAFPYVPVTVSSHRTADVIPDLIMPPVVGNPPDAADQVDYTVAGAIDALLRGEQGEPTLPQTFASTYTE
ncbi:hypothetical protein LSAT2_006793 [Lamellibrachia satsuma]|nr:hypothetical protein LSAT2_006793 [Lamellibrachia satsuma]